MKVSFTGINNIMMKKQEYDKHGAYLSPDYEIKIGNKHCTILHIHCNLTDDDKGNDFTNFKTAVSKCGSNYSEYYIDGSTPNQLNIFMKREEANDSLGDVSMSVFWVNGYPVIMDSKNILPLCSYMAHFSKKLAGLPYMSDAGKYYMNLLNKSVDEEARKFLDTY